MALAEEVEFSRRHEIQHGDLGEAEFIDKPAEGGAGEKQRREHRGNDADNQRDGETLHGSRSLPEENECRDERGDIRIKNGAEGLVVGSREGGGERFSGLEFLTEAFVDEHIRVHRHANRQNDAGDAREGQREVEHRHCAEKQNHVQQKPNHGHKADEAVVKHGENHHQHETGDAGQHAALDRVSSERGRHAAGFFDLNWHPKRIFKGA